MGVDLNQHFKAAMMPWQDLTQNCLGHRNDKYGGLSG